MAVIVSVVFAMLPMIVVLMLVMADFDSHFLSRRHEANHTVFSHHRQIVQFQKFQGFRHFSRQIAHGGLQPRGQPAPHPDHQVGLRQCARLRGTHLKHMRIGVPGQKQAGLSQIAHHHRRKAMHRQYVGDHARGLRRRGSGCKQ